MMKTNEKIDFLNSYKGIEFIFLFSKEYQDYNDLLFEENLNSFDGGKIKTNYLLRPTIYYRYIIANRCKDFFKNIIKTLDKNNEYFKVSYVEGINKEKVDKAIKEYYNKNVEKFELFNKDLDNWRKEHSNYYRIQTCLPTSSDFINDEVLKDFNFESYINISSITIEEAIDCYKACNEFIKYVDTMKPNPLDKFCIEKKPMLNYEHREEYNEFKASLYKKYDLLTDNEIKESLPKETIEKTRLSLNRQKSNLENINKIRDFVILIDENLKN